MTVFFGARSLFLVEISINAVKPLLHICYRYLSEGMEKVEVCYSRLNLAALERDCEEVAMDTD